MALDHEEYVSACAKVGELIGLIVVSMLADVPAKSVSSKTVDALGAEAVLTRDEAAKECKVSRNTFKGWEVKGLIKRIPNMGERTVRFRKSDVDKLKKRQRE